MNPNLRYISLFLALVIGAISAQSQTISTFPHYEDLETWDTCNTNCGFACIPGNGWSNQGTAEFVTDTNGTPTSLTGPALDHNPATISGRYTYVESSGACNSDTAILESPFIDLSSVVNPRVKWWYHQYNGATGAATVGADTFRVLVTTDSGLTWATAHVGPNQDTANQWMPDSFDLSIYSGLSIKLRWVFITTNQFNDFALDDFSFLGDQTLDVGVDSIHSASGFCADDSTTICFRLSNFGIIDVDTVTIVSTINGTPFNSPLVFTNTLLAGDDTVICLGSANLSTGDTIRIYSTMPNNQQDTFNLNDTAEMIVTIFTPPTANAGLDTTICGLSNYTLGGTPTTNFGSVFDWTTGAFLNDSTTANPVAYFTQSGTFTYTLNVTDSNLCDTQDTVVITVHPIPIHQAGNDTTVCIGDSVTIGGSPTTTAPNTVVWSSPSLLNDSSLFNPQAFIPITQIFYLTVTDTFGCNYDDTVNIFTSSNPGLTAGDSSGVCLGDSIALGGSPTASNFQSIVWTPSATLSNDTVPNPLASPSLLTTYTITLVDTHGCTYEDSVEIGPIALPFADAGPDTLLCAYDSFTIGGTPTGNLNSIYSWSPASLFGNPNEANPTVAVLFDTLLIVAVTDTVTGCTAMDTSVISTHAKPVADAGFTAFSICFADTVTLGGNPTTGAGNQVLWSPGAGLSDSTAFNPLLTASTSAQIILTSTEPVNGCKNFDTIDITVDTLPVIDAGPVVSFCLNDSVTLGGAPTGPVGVQYAWSYSPLLNDSTVSNPIGSPSQDTLFFVTVSDGNGCMSIDSQQVIVDSLPIPVVDLVPDTSCLGDSTQLQASGGVAYVWSNSTFLTDDSIADPFAFFPLTSNVSLTVTDANGCSDSLTITVPYWDLPIVGAGSDDTICSGNQAALQATGALTYAWTPTNGLNDPAVSNPMASPSSTQSYVVEGTDINGCKATDTVTVFVNVLPPASAGPNKEVCLNDSVSLGGNPTGPVGSEFLWNTTMVNFDTLANPFFLASTVGSFTVQVTVTDQNLCQSTDEVDIVVHQLPVGSITIPNVTICNDDSLQIFSSGGVSYQWSPGSSLDDASAQNPFAFPFDTTIYSVTVTDINGCTDTLSDTLKVYPPNVANAGNDTTMCQQDTITLMASGGVGYQWNSSFTLINGETDTPKVFPIQTETYTVTVTDVNGCVNFDQIVVTVKPLPNISAGLDKRICRTDEVSIGGNPTGSTANTYLWIPSIGLSDSTVRNPKASPDTSTTYKVVGTTVFGCRDSAEMRVEVDTLPLIAIITPPQAICLGDTSSVEVTFGLASYSWDPVEGIVDPNVPDAFFNPENSTTYYLTVTDSVGCKNYDTIKVEVMMLPTAEASEDVEICERDSTKLRATGGVLYDWSFAATLNDPTDNNTGKTWAHPTITTIYTVTVTDTNGCQDTDETEVVVYPLPVADAGADIENCDIDLVFIGRDSVPGSYEYTWTPASGLSDPQDPHPYLIEPDNEVYVLEVQDRNGCYAYDSVEVRGDCYALIYAPTAFTPGADGVNDEFKVVAHRITDTELKIFTRWGDLVFQTNDLEIGWDGTVNGEVDFVQSTVYHWVLTYKTENLKKKTKQGTVTLLR